MAINGNRSNFTADKNYTIDSFVEMFELSTEDVSNVQRWKLLKSKNRTEEENQELESLTELLSGKLVTAEAWNKLCDCMVNLETLYKDKGLDQIESTVEDYIANDDVLNQRINDKVGTTIDGLLLTNATQIIISSTQPAVVNGAVWFKPKTN